MTTKLQRNGKIDLVDELGITARRVNQLIELGVIVAGADGDFDVALNVRRFEAYKDRDVDYVERELREAAEKYKAGLSLLRAEPDVVKRRAIDLEIGVGAQIGRTDRAFLLGNALAFEEQRPLLKLVTNRTVGEMASELMEILEYRYIGDKAPNRRDRRRAAAL